MLMMILIQILLLVLMVLISVAFLTLLERKILGYIQLRKGPNKVSFIGLLQPFSDALKLISKEWFMLDLNFYMFILSPMFMLISMMMLWYIYPWFYIEKISYSLILFMLILGFNIYPVISVGWSASNNYAMLGTLRAVGQMISFEINLFLMIMILMMMIESFSFNDLMIYQVNMKFVFFMWPLYLMLFLSILIELNRTPFDLIEGESELVSGFNVEYYSSSFTLIFLSEYSSLMFMSMLLTIMFWGFDYWSLMFIIIYMIHMLLLLWIRGVLPRIRYDELMFMCWNELLMLMLIYTLYIYMLKEFFIVMS